MDKSSGNSDPRDITLGCGPTSSSSPSSQSSSSDLVIPPPITINITTTTGGSFSVVVDVQNSVENLKKIVAKKLKVAKDRICLLHREKELQDGSVKENGLMDGSKIILIPNVETGLLAQRPENTVMQALESLNDSQVNDFLSGKTPLNLSMRLGDHMMLIQLQLSTVNPISPLNSGRSRSNQRSSRSSSSIQSIAPNVNSSQHQSTASRKLDVDAVTNNNRHTHSSINLDSSSLVSVSSASASTSTSTRLLSNMISTPSTLEPSKILPISPTTTATAKPTVGTLNKSVQTGGDLNSFLMKHDFKSLQHIVKSISIAQPTISSSSGINNPSTNNSNNSTVEKCIGISSTASSSLSSASSTTTTVMITDSNMTSNDESKNCCTNSNSLRNTSQFHNNDVHTLLEQSPIKSLSNLVSSPIKTTSIKNIPISSHHQYTADLNPSSNTQIVAIGSTSNLVSASGISSSSTSSSLPLACSDPISAKLTSCLCKSFNSKSCEVNPCQSSRNANGEITNTDFSIEKVNATSTPNFKQHSISNGLSTSSTTLTPTSSPPSSLTSLLHKTANNPFIRSKHRLHHHHHHHHHHHYHHNGVSGGSTHNLSLRKSQSDEKLRLTDSGISLTSSSDSNSSTSLINSSSGSSSNSNSNSNNNSTATTAAIDLDDSMTGITVSDTRALAEASRNLTQTLRKLSKEVFTNKLDLNSEEAPRKTSSGAVIESMKNHGKGIYSGTFSGTLNPALQDRFGRPKRDISTVIHILNDLLSATPQYSRGGRISFETPSLTASSSSRSKQSSSKHSSTNVTTDTCLKCLKSSTTCLYGECNGHYAGSSTTPSSSSRSIGTPCISKHNRHHSSVCQHHHHHHHDLSTASTSSFNSCFNSNTSCSDLCNLDDRSLCTCRYRGTNESGEPNMCAKCSVEMENNKTKCKLDQLRLVMQQRKQNREARKLKGAPYGARVVGTTSTTSATAATATTSALSPLSSPSEVTPNHIVEEVKTAA